MLQQTLEIGTPLKELPSSPNTFFLQFNLPRLLFEHSNWSPYCVHADMSWITWNGNNVLWLHKGYRSSLWVVSLRRNPAICCVGVGYRS